MEKTTPGLWKLVTPVILNTYSVNSCLFICFPNLDIYITIKFVLISHWHGEFCHIKSHVFFVVKQSWYPINTMDGCEILHQLIGGKHSIVIDFQPSFWWRRISQPSTIHSRWLIGGKYMAKPYRMDPPSYILVYKRL